MTRLWRWLKILLLAAVGLLLLYVVLALVFMDFMVDMWWFESLGFLSYFFWRLTYRYIILIIFSLLFFLVFFLNFWVASWFLGTAPPEGDQPSLARSRYRYFLDKFRSGSLRVYTLPSASSWQLSWPGRSSSAGRKPCSSCSPPGRGKRSGFRHRRQLFSLFSAHLSVHFAHPGSHLGAAVFGIGAALLDRERAI
jgi:hypothetical protein